MQQTNRAGHVTKADYDDRMGTLLRVIGPNSSGGTVTNCSTTTYTVPASEESTCAVYDVFGRITKLIKPGDSTTYPTVEWVYADAETPVRYVTRQREASDQAPYRAMQTFYDGLGRQIQTKRQSGRDSSGNGNQNIVADTQYDGLGHVIKTSQPHYVNQTGTAYSSYTAPGTYVNPTTTSYDALGRVSSVVEPGSRTTSTSYGVDAVGMWTKVIDPDSYAVVRWSDALGRRLQVTEYTGTSSPRTPYATTSYSYDALDQLVHVTDAANNGTWLVYDSLGRKTQMTDGDMGTWYYAYDLNGNLTQLYDAKGQTMYLGYDALDRLTSMTMAGNQASYYAYDDPATPYGIGRRSAMSSYTNGVEQSYAYWQYDARGRVSWTGQRVASLVHNLGYTYSTADEVLTMSYPSGEQLTYSYDVAGRASSLCSSLGGCYVSGAGYTALDQPDYWTLGNGLVVDWAYNSQTAQLGRLKVGSVFDRSYAYDPAGNVTSLVDNTTTPIPNQSYSYDAVHRLSSWTSGSTTQSYSYTTNGNLSAKAGVSYGYGAQSASCAVPSLLKVHAVTSVGGASYCYDRNGNLTSGGGRTYTWDAANRLSSISQTSGSESYSYDAEGERVKLVRGTTTTVYFQDIWEAVVGGGTKAYYTFNGQVVAMRDSGGVSYLHIDHLGSVSAATNSAQQASEQEYDPWGKVRSGGVTQTSVNYTGQRLDGTGLLYYHARMYDPGLGRFVSADSVVLGSASGSMDGVALKPLTVDFHEPGFVSQLSEENRQGFWFQLSEEDKQKAGSPWGPANPLPRLRRNRKV